MPDATVTLRTRADLAALVATRQSFNVLSAEEQKAERQALALAQSMARLDGALRQPEVGAQRLRAALSNAAYIDPRQGAAALNQIISLEQKAEAEAAKLARAQAGLGTAGGLPILPRTLESFGTGAVEQFKSSLLGVVGPAALVTAGFAAAGKAVEFFGDSFKFKAQIDQTTASIGIQLRGLRDSAETFASASAFAAKYRFTQEQTTEAIQAAIPVIRSSKSSTEDILGVFARLQVLKPEKTFGDAARALGELKAGQIISIVDQFNISRAAANRMKDEIAGGADAVQVLSRYLTENGIGMDALATRTRGATGAINEQAIAYERLRLAAAGATGGPGLVLTKAKTAGIDTLTAELSGQGDLAAANRAFLATLVQTGDAIAAFDARAKVLNLTTGAQAAVFDEDRQAIGKVQIANEAANDVEDRRVRTLSALATAHQAAAQAIRDQTKEIDASAQKSVIDAAAKETQQAKTALMSAQAKQAVDGFLALNPKIEESGILALVAAGRLSAETGQLAILGLRAQGATSDLIALNNAQKQGKVDQLVTLRSSQGIGSGRGGGSDAVAESAAFVGALKTQNQEQAKLLDSEIALAGAKKQTGRQIELLRQKQAQFGKGTAEFNSIEAQIIGIQTAGGTKRVSAAQTTALQLQNVEENSQLALAKTQREGLERLRDQEADFTLRRVRSKEDEDRKIRRLLAGGQIAAARREREDFAIQQRRDQEDFNIQRQRTVRNNSEGTGDIGARTDLRQEQIGNRAALRGVKTNGGATLGNIPTPSGGEGAPAAPSAAGNVLQIVVQANTNLDSQKVGELIFDTIRQKLDDNFALELRSATPPGAGQDAVSGSRP